MHQTEAYAGRDCPDCAELIRLALEAREKAYAPYSGFMVGAALLTQDGAVYTGCNVENAAFSPTNCAERTAFFKAVSEGRRRFSAIAVVGAMQGAAPESFAYVYPCGVCRQVMAEFCDADFQVVAAKNPEDYVVRTLAGILPEAFGPGDIEK